MLNMVFVYIFIFASVFLHIYCQHGYRNINIEIVEDDFITKEKCREILSSLEETLTSASEILYSALNGKLFFMDFNIYLPNNWEDGCIPQKSKWSESNGSDDHSQFLVSQSIISMRGTSDIILTNSTSQLPSVGIWTQQYGMCGMPGLKMFATYEGLLSSNSGKTFVKEWAKYRYGVFDEIGYKQSEINPMCYTSDGILHINGCTDYEPEQDLIDKLCTDDDKIGQQEYDLGKLVNPLARTSLMFLTEGSQINMFCDSGNHNRYAPTKHNYLCDRRPTLDIISNHEDFTSFVTQNQIAQSVDTKPTFKYIRRSLTRYIVVIDNSLGNVVRESWSFLRSAFRKWILYDLMDNSEVGVVLTTGRNTSRILDLTNLGNNTKRDLVASFLPYSPKNLYQAACITCALDKALELLDKHQNKYGNAAHVIMFIASGMDKTTEVTEFKKQLNRSRNPTKVVTINYPNLGGVSRSPLDILATDPGLSFTINEEKYNNEKSYLDCYVHLSNVLMYLAGYFYEHHGVNELRAPLEVYRREIRESSQQLICGNFYLEAGFGLPAGFFVYTHSAETPLIQSMRLISPSGRNFESRSDQRMLVKQLSLLATLNETGNWYYEFRRYPGNPQPNVVQVLATPQVINYIMTESWIAKYKNCFFLYTKIVRGLQPVTNANVTATIMYRKWKTGTGSLQTLQLYDNGSGDIDITANDGIYSQKLKLHGAGSYSFEFYSRGKYFSRYSPLYTQNIEPQEFENISQTKVPVRILDFRLSKVNDSHFEFTWSACSSELKSFELRYSYNLYNLIDNFENAILISTINEQVCTENRAILGQRYVHDFSNISLTYGEIVYFALKAQYLQPITNTPLSNIVEYFSSFSSLATVPTDNASPIVSTVDYSTESNFNSSNGLVTGMSVHLLHFMQYVIAICLALFVVFVLILVYCYLKYCRLCQKKKLAANKSSSDTNIHKTDSSVEATINPMPNAIGYLLPDQNNHPRYDVFDAKLEDHLTLGIPVLTSQERQVYNSLNSKINIISSTLDHKDNIEYWSTAISNQLEEQRPPVPPLPLQCMRVSTSEQHCPTQFEVTCPSTYTNAASNAYNQLPFHYYSSDPYNQHYESTCATTEVRTCRNVTVV